MCGEVERNSELLYEVASMNIFVELDIDVWNSYFGKKCNLSLNTKGSNIK